MTTYTKLQLFLGTLIFSVIIAAGVLYINDSQAMSTSQKAEIKANSYTVGIDYSGIVIKQYVNEGDRIKQGEPLFEIKSSTLTENINNNKLSVNDLLYPINKKGNIVITSTSPGVVTNVFFQEGSFVPANKELATITDANSVYVQATYRLAPRDFSKISKQSRVIVTLPDNSKVDGRVKSIKVISQTDIIVVEIEARLSQLNITEFKSTSGTPVSTVLVLDENTYLKELQALYTRSTI